MEALLMEFGLSKEQALLQDSVGRFLDRCAPLERVKQIVAAEQPRADEVWAGLCDQGIPGMLIGEQYGGIGLSLLDAALVAETLGSRIAPVAFVATAVMAPLAIELAGSGAQKSRWLPDLAEGKITAGAALTEAVSTRLDAGVRAEGSKLHGTALFVLDFDADVYLVADKNHALYLVEATHEG
jgi:alkylation response protein AidB-like acyl-CoA dehydrogenase